jgi:hypothetical protein
LPAENSKPAVFDFFRNARVQAQHKLAQRLHQRKTVFTEPTNVFQQTGNAWGGHGDSSVRVLLELFFIKAQPQGNAWVAE